MCSQHSLALSGTGLWSSDLGVGSKRTKNFKCDKVTERISISKRKTEKAGAKELAQQEKVFTTKLENLKCEPQDPCGGQRGDFCKLSSDHHICQGDNNR